MAERPRLLLDVMLGKLATYLRMCGYDAAYALDRDAEGSESSDSSSAKEPPFDPRADDDLLALARAEDRLVLTRDTRLAERADESLLLESLDVVGQLRELDAAGFDLALSEPSRCARCNGTLESVFEGPTPEYAPEPTERPVWRCRSCGRYYWKGSHWDDVEETLSSL